MKQQKDLPYFFQNVRVFMYLMSNLKVNSISKINYDTVIAQNTNKARHLKNQDSLLSTYIINNFHDVMLILKKTFDNNNKNKK